MNESLDLHLLQWLSRVSDEWDMSVEQVASNVGKDEIDNRMTWYPKVRMALLNPPIDLQRFAQAAHECWVLHHRHDTIRLSEFVSNGPTALGAIEALIDDFPEDDESAEKRIDAFVAEAEKLGYSTPTGSSDRAGAAQLASIILTSLYPSRFVDFRQKRWRALAREFGYEVELSGATYGQMLVWAGKFAREISETTTYQRYWSKPEEKEPLWVIAGISWEGPSPAKPGISPSYVEEESFPEGEEKWRLHRRRERSRAVVDRAKRLALKNDPMLRCQVCGFSFVEKYGEIGEDFIEAHHTKPIADLEPGGRTKAEDIALLCANCHRMIHRGDHTLTLDELASMMRE